MIAEQALGPNAVDRNLDRFVGECLRECGVAAEAAGMLVYVVVRMIAWDRAGMCPSSARSALADLARMAETYFEGKEKDETRSIGL